VHCSDGTVRYFYCTATNSEGEVTSALVSWSGTMAPVIITDLPSAVEVMQGAPDVQLYVTGATTSLHAAPSMCHVSLLASPPFPRSPSLSIPQRVSHAHSSSQVAYRRADESECCCRYAAAASPLPQVGWMMNGKALDGVRGDVLSVSTNKLGRATFIAVVANAHGRARSSTCTVTIVDGRRSAAVDGGDAESLHASDEHDMRAATRVTTGASV
jgi:hypothetical protein